MVSVEGSAVDVTVCFKTTMAALKEVSIDAVIASVVSELENVFQRTALKTYVGANLCLLNSHNLYPNRTQFTLSFFV